MRHTIKIMVVLALVITIAGEAAGQRTRKAVRGKGTRPAAAANTFDGAMRMASAAYQKGSYTDAVRFARKASELNPEDFRPFTVLANSFLKTGSFEDALTSAQTARAKSPPTEAAELDDLIKSITDSKAGADQVKAAEAAAARGDARQAAEAYQRAFGMMPERADLGLKAASIHNDQLKNYAESIRIVNQIILTSKDPEITTSAKDLLGIAEDNQRRDAEDRERRQAEQRRLEAERQETERRMAAEREREQRSAAARARIQELESKRDSLQQEMESAQEQADDDDQRAQRFESEAASYDAQPYGALSAGIARIAAQRYKNSANRNRSKARQLQNEISQMDREISRLQRDM